MYYNDIPISAYSPLIIPNMLSELIQKICNDMTLPSLEQFINTFIEIHNICIDILQNKKILINPLIHKYEVKQEMLEKLDHLPEGKILEYRKLNNDEIVITKYISVPNYPRENVL